MYKAQSKGKQTIKNVEYQYGKLRTLLKAENPSLEYILWRRYNLVQSVSRPLGDWNEDVLKIIVQLDQAMKAVSDFHGIITTYRQLSIKNRKLSGILRWLWEVIMRALHLWDQESDVQLWKLFISKPLSKVQEQAFRHNAKMIQDCLAALNYSQWKVTELEPLLQTFRRGLEDGRVEGVVNGKMNIHGLLTAMDDGLGRISLADVLI